MVGITVCSYSAERLVQINDIGHRYKATEAVTLSVYTVAHPTKNDNVIIKNFRARSKLISILIQFSRNKFRSYSVLVLKILIVFVLVLVNERLIIFVLVLILVHARC